jgi:ring-1,2-phenylacetyl-CoA epoxidase subunit PaaE
MATPRFHSLQICDVRQETPDSVSVAFQVPATLRADYQFTQGQFLTLKTVVNGEELRRSYSICVSTRHYDLHGRLRVGIKQVVGGKFSNWANLQLKAGQSIDVMTPDGRFHTPLQAEAKRHYLGIAGGSGITPMLSIIETTLETETASQFTLLYGNRNSASVMFLEELDGLKSRFLQRFQLVHILSEEPQEIDLFHGVLDQARCTQLLAALQLPARLDHAFICGPEPMMNAAEAALLAAGLPAKGISIERFGSPLPAGSHAAKALPVAPKDNAPKAQVWLTVDGKARLMQVPYEGQAILDAGLAAGANLPYACKGGVCCTCRAKVLEGEVRMDKNYTLEPEEIRQGFVLTCQAHPVSDLVRISFDER